MADVAVCGKCGSKFKVAGQKPGAKLRCRAEGCGGVVVVGGEQPPAEEEPAAPEPKAGKAARGERPSSRRAAAGSGRRGKSDETAGSPDRRSARGPKRPAGTALLIAGGGIALVVILIVVAFVATSGGSDAKPAKGKGKKGATETAAKPDVPAEPEAPPPEEAKPEEKPAEAEAKPAAKPKPAPKPAADGKAGMQRGERFVEDPAGQAALAVMPRLATSDTDAAEKAKAELKAIGKPAVSTILNYLAGLKVEGEAEMDTIFNAIEAMKEILGDDETEDVGKLRDAAHPDGRDLKNSSRAVSAWRVWWGKNGGKVEGG